jgi:hypothetical protein
MRPLPRRSKPVLTTKQGCPTALAGHSIGRTENLPATKPGCPRFAPAYLGDDGWIPLLSLKGATAFGKKIRWASPDFFVPRTLWRTRISCYAAPGQNRVCGFLHGKPRAARQRHQPRQEIRGTWGTRGYSLISSSDRRIRQGAGAPGATWETGRVSQSACSRCSASAAFPAT